MKEVFLNFANLQILSDNDYLSLSNEDVFFLRVFFKFKNTNKILTLKNSESFLQRVWIIENLF